MKRSNSNEYYRTLFDVAKPKEQILSELRDFVSKIQRKIPNSTLNLIGKYKIISASIYSDSSLLFPWEFVALVHRMEASSDEDKQIMNGGLWKDQSVGSIKVTSFIQSATLNIKEFFRKYRTNPKVVLASPESILYWCEAWNGWGYRNKGLHSPYIIGGIESPLYDMEGKYTKDGEFDSSAKTKQVGCAILLKHLSILGISSIK
jgi:lysozyme family protein